MTASFSAFITVPLRQTLLLDQLAEHCRQCEFVAGLLRRPDRDLRCLEAGADDAIAVQNVHVDLLELGDVPYDRKPVVVFIPATTSNSFLKSFTLKQTAFET
jgi:hypothetical protein